MELGAPGVAGLDRTLAPFHFRLPEEVQHGVILLAQRPDQPGAKDTLERTAGNAGKAGHVAKDGLDGHFLAERLRQSLARDDVAGAEMKRRNRGKRPFEEPAILELSGVIGFFHG